MKYFLASVGAMLLLTTPAYAADWTLIAANLLKSVVLVENATGQGLCSGFVIDNNRDFVLTANHCESKEMVVDGIPAKVVAKDLKKDLLVLHVPGIDKPALKLAKDDPKVGTEAASLGFGYGLEQPMFRVAHISMEKAYIPYEGIGGPFVVTDTSFVPGQSGGPVVNTSGEVVMMVQFGDGGGRLGAGVGAETIRSKMGRYFTVPSAKD